MRFYRVGGCVRDHFMGVQSHDVDYLVTGATEAEFLQANPFNGNFKKVGADFPVYLDDTGSEWAFARTERSTGAGYHAFEVIADKSITFEQDASRRDLTINAMGIEIFNDGKTRVLNVEDPFGGENDIRNKILRHVSPAFAEDPVRVLRLARLRARFGPDWKVAPETQVICSKMSKSGVLSSLQPDRVWKEMSRALMEPHPRLFFDTLLEVDALHTIFPMIYKLKTALEARIWHPEGDAFEHTMLVLTAAAKMGATLEERIACVCHDLGKGLTPRDKLPKHYGHDVNGVAVVDEFAKTASIPSDFIANAKLATRYHMSGHNLDKLNAKTFVKMFDALGANHTSNRAASVLMMVFKADERGRLGYENNSVDIFGVFDKNLEKYRSVKFTDVFPNGMKDTSKIADGMFRARVKAVGEK